MTAGEGATQPPIDEGTRQRFVDAWYSRLSQQGQEEYLLAPERHAFLETIWEEGDEHPDWLSRRTIPDTLLVDHIEPPQDQHLSYVCRGVRSYGTAVCVKIAWTSGQFSPERNAARNQAIENEARILRHLQQFTSRSGQVSTWIADGALVDSTGQRRAWVATRYVPALQRLSDVASQLDTSQVIRLLVDFARLLGDLHAARVVHGDLHSGNLYVSAGRPVILDFGSSQLASHRLLKRNRIARNFHPRLPFPMQEHDDPLLPLTPAYDVACLAHVGTLLLSDRIQREVQCEAGTIEHSDLAEDQNVHRGSKLNELQRSCSHYEPAYRLRTGHELAEAFQRLIHGAPFQTRHSLRTHVFAKLDRYRGFVLSLAAIATVLLFMGGLAFFFYVQSRERKDQALFASIRELRARVQQTYRSDTRGQARQSSQSVQQEIERLLEQMGQDQLNQDAAEQALLLAMESCQSFVDNKGYDDALGPASVTVRLAETCEKLFPEAIRFSLLSLEATGLKLRCEYENRTNRQSGSPPDNDEFVKANCRLIERFLTIVRNEANRLSSADVLRTAQRLGQTDIAPLFRSHAAHVEARRCTYDLVETALSFKSTSRDFRTLYWTAMLQSFRALARHKSAYWPDEKNGVQATELIRSELRDVLRLLDEGQSLDTEQILDWNSARAEVRSRLGLNLTSHHPQNLPEAIQELNSAFDYRMSQAVSDPLSLNLQRDAADCGWSLADALKEQWTQITTAETRASLQNQEIDVRRRVTAIARQLCLIDRSKGSQSIMSVNVARLAHVLLAANRDEECAELAADPVVVDLGLIPQRGEGSGTEMIGAIALAWRRHPDENTLLRFRRHAEAAAFEVESIVARNGFRTPSLHAFVDPLREQIEEIPELAALPEWTQLKNALDQALIRTRELNDTPN